VPTERRADRPAVVVDARPGREAVAVALVDLPGLVDPVGLVTLVDDARVDDVDVVALTDPDALADFVTLVDDARLDDERVDVVLADEARLDDDRVDVVRAERVVDRAGERRDPVGRAPPPPEDVRPDPLREVTAWPRCTA
jgi:hypothetical protein